MKRIFMSKIAFVMLIGVVFLFGVIGKVKASPIPALTFSGPSASGWDPSQPAWVGYRFTVISDIDVTALGYYDWLNDGLTNNHQVALWDSGGTLLGTTMVNSGTVNPLIDVFRYSNLGTSIGLSAGNDYYISGDPNGDVWVHDVGSWATDPTIIWNESRQFVFGGLTFPSIIIPGHEWMTVNFLLDTNPIPEPTTIALLGIGLAGLGGRYLKRRRKQRADA